MFQMCIIFFSSFDITSLLSGDHPSCKEARALVDDRVVDDIHFFQHISGYLSRA
jgi:hypothetical protein